MATYTIIVSNNSACDKSYVVFMDKPTVTAAGATKDVFTDAWVTFNGVKQGSHDTVTYTDVTSAYWATTTLPIGPNSTMGQAGNTFVDTTKQDGVAFIGTGPGIGFTDATPKKASTGSFSIIAGSDFIMSNGYVFGLARPGNIPGIPSPVATFIAEPNETYNVTPVIKFYVADGAYTPGQIIDVSTTSTVSGEIDFTGRSQTSCVVTQGPHGDFTVKYY